MVLEVSSISAMHIIIKVRPADKYWRWLAVNPDDSQGKRCCNLHDTEVKLPEGLVSRTNSTSFKGLTYLLS